MISGHIVAVADVQAAIQNLRNTVELMPECRLRYQLEARIELMEQEADRLASQSLGLYDQLFKFASSALSLNRHIT